MSPVNLFVGLNGAGKTSVLEAAELLTGGTPPLLWASGSRRGESIRTEVQEYGRTVDLGHMFRGHALRTGATFEITATGMGTEHRVACSIVDAGPEFFPKPAAIDSAVLRKPPSDAMQDARPGLGLKFESTALKAPAFIRIASDGALLDQSWNTFPSPHAEIPLVNFLAPQAVNWAQLSRLWNSVALTPHEEEMLEALKIIDASIERVTLLVSGPHSQAAEFFVKKPGIDQPLPVGTLGDGVRRLLYLALFLIASSGGFLMIDEIDTGLHYSAMPQMWSFLVRTALRVNCQVFATTHSLDCVKALGRLFETERVLAEKVSVHRVEAGLDSTVRYSADAIHLAAGEQIEVR